MKKTIIILMGVILMAACGHKVNREEQIQKIEEMEQSFENDILNQSADEESTLQMLSLYRGFYNNFPDDSLAPVYMQRAADFCITTGHANTAIELLDSVVALYPGFEDLGGCWFLKGYAYEAMENYDSARVAYTYFVDNYPDHYLASDTRMMLNYLGLSPEEMFDAMMAAATDKDLVQN